MSIMLADDLKRLQNQAVARKQSEDLAARIRVSEEKTARRKAVMDQAKELFERVEDKLRESADRGEAYYDYRYNGESETSKFEAEAIADEAKGRGFVTQFKSEASDMGDFAAPCWTTFHWLEIRWGSSKSGR